MRYCFPLTFNRPSFLSSLTYLALIVLGLMSLSFHASAQDRNANSEASQNIDFSTVPKAYMKESRLVYKNCKANSTKRLYYDCQCLAFEFLQERIEAGPDASMSSIEFSLQGKCRDATEAAGFEYSECLKGYNMFPPGTDPEKFCACYANAFVQNIDEAAPILQSSTITPLKVRARVTCQNPTLARKLYGR